MADQDADKTQDPTPHRRQQAREQGQVARSQDLGSAALLLAGLSALLMLGEPLIGTMGALAQRCLGETPAPADVDSALAQFNDLVWLVAPPLLPVLAAMLVVSIGVNVAQVGLLFLPEKLAPDLSRIDPLKGFSRMFSLTGVARLGFGFVKVVLVAAVAYAVLSGHRDAVLGLSGLGLPEIAVYLVDCLLWTGIKIAAALLFLALLDYGFQWWRQEQDLRMTLQEIREEMRNLQGDPQIISRRRQVQRQLVMNRLKTAVPKADVVITNPTELAIAIEYDLETMAAPVVVAKGAGVLAQRIRRLALENGIPIVEKKPLAQALYKDVELNHPIPNKMYAAVAEVLAYVYQLKGKTAPEARNAER
ncbi:MAG TPA: flagellar biosynthesis protein FlhB [Pirellulales bacterium]|nr:flagellar biosynthesis protein FlhB [Pirellulales bacterium]